MIQIERKIEGPPNLRKKYIKVYEHILTLKPVSDWYCVSFDNARQPHSLAACIRKYLKGSGVKTETATRKRPDHVFEYWYRRIA
jgi:hypothetical protein